MIIVQNKFSDAILFKGYIALAFFPFLFIRPGVVVIEEIITHERIHFKQQIEMLIIGFYIWYILEFLIRLLWNWWEFGFFSTFQIAYLDLSLEKEAYRNEHDPNYLSGRKPYNWLRLL